MKKYLWILLSLSNQIFAKKNNGVLASSRDSKGVASVLKLVDTLLDCMSTEFFFDTLSHAQKDLLYRMIKARSVFDPVYMDDKTYSINRKLQDLFLSLRPSVEHAKSMTLYELGDAFQQSSLSKYENSVILVLLDESESPEDHKIVSIIKTYWAMSNLSSSALNITHEQRSLANILKAILWFGIEHFYWRSSKWPQRIWKEKDFLILFSKLHSYKHRSDEVPVDKILRHGILEPLFWASRTFTL
jgi:hypothetical protein